MKILVTGATGFIGRHLVKKLIKPGIIVTCLVRNLEKAESLKKLDVKLIKGDINDRAIVQHVLENQDVVYHLAAIGNSSFVSENDYYKYYKTNVEGTENIMEGCIKNKIKKIVYFSSIAVMGITKDKISDENSECYPVSPYQRSKYEAEKLVLNYYKKYNLPVVIIRPTMVYGLMDKDHSEISRITKFIKLGIIPIIGKGYNSIPLVHVNDLVNGAILAEKYGRSGQVYIITSENKYSLNEIIKTISDELGKKILIIRIPKIIAQIIIFPIELISKVFKFKSILTLKRIESMTNDRIFSVEKAKKELGYKQTIGLKEGIKNQNFF